MENFSLQGPGKLVVLFWSGATENAGKYYSLLGCRKASGVNLKERLVYFLNNINQYDKGYSKDRSVLLPHNYKLQQRIIQDFLWKLPKYSEYDRRTLKVRQYLLDNQAGEYSGPGFTICLH